MANVDSNKNKVDQSRESYADDAKARRVFIVDDAGDSTVLRGHPDVNANVSTAWTITRADGQPDSENVTFDDTSEYTRSFTYDGEGFMTARTKWTLV